MGGIYSYGYVEDVSLRVAGITGGAWELSAVLAIFTVPLIYDKQFVYYKKIIMIIISAIIIYLANTRSGMVAYVVASMFALFHVYRISIYRIAIISIISVLFFFNTRPKYFQTTLGGMSLPGSLATRLDNWYKHYILMDGGDYIWGKGLGFSGLYLDGMYAKIFVDMGIIGTLLFFVYYYTFLKSYKSIALIAIIFSFTIDFFTASKIMFALYLSAFYLKLISNQPYNPNRLCSQDNISSQIRTSN